MFRKNLIFLILILSIFVYCSKKTNSASTKASAMGLIANMFSSFNSAPLIKNIAENVIYSHYASLEKQVSSLKSLATVLPDSCGSDTSKLTAIQEAWKSAYSTLKNIELIQFGASGSYSTIDSWPINYLLNPPDISKINATIAGFEVISETNLSFKSDNENGFPSIEYLLYDNGSGSNTASAICTALTGRRKTYLVEAINLLSTRISRIAFNWNPTTSGNFSTILQTSGASNEFYKSEKEVLDLLIKQIVLQIERIKDDKIGYPAGYSADSGGTIRSTYVETRFANISTKAISDNLTGIYLLYVGNNGPGLADYIRYYNISLDERIRAKIRQAQAKANEIQDLKGDIGKGNLTTVKELHTLINELKILFTVELAGNLGSNFNAGLGGGDGD